MATPTEPSAFTLEAYNLQLEDKQTETLKDFSQFGVSSFDVYASSHKHYRMRAEFKIWHEANRAHYAMHQPGIKNKPYIITDFPAASLAIGSRMPPLLDAINQCDTLKSKLFQVEFLTTTTDECVISLIYHRPLDDHWRQEAENLSKVLQTSSIGRSRKQNIVIGNDWVEEALNINAQVLRYQQIENSFTQPNAGICQAMLTWCIEHSTSFGGDLLELYCGNGNFSIALSQNFSKILATEISKPSIRSALHNCGLNNVTNIEFIRMSSEEFTDAKNQVREFRRLKDVDLEGYKFSTILVDPPRAGLDDNTRTLCSEFKNIIYISCNPDTLKRDLMPLIQTHEISRAALFDQFPFTHHRECGVILRRKSH